VERPDHRESIGPLPILLVRTNRVTTHRSPPRQRKWCLVAHSRVMRHFFLGLVAIELPAALITSCAFAFKKLK